MPLPKAPQKPADKLLNLPSTASEAAHSLQATRVTMHQQIETNTRKTSAVDRANDYPAATVVTKPDMRLKRS
jgi:hypothetical protein